MWHRYIGLLLALALLCVGGCAAEDDSGAAAPTTEATTTTPATVDQDAQATELADAWIAAWDANDPEAVAAVFTEDGVHICPGGNRHEGREAIARHAEVTPPLIAPARVSDVTLGRDGMYVFRAKYGWDGADTYASDVQLELDGDRASYIGWTGPEETYRGTYDHLFEAAYTGLLEATSGGFCNEGWVPMEGTVTGTEAELGPFEATARHCSNPETGELAGGTLVMVMADGDELHGTYEGWMLRQEEDGSLTMRMVQTYEGGTGRFADAEGEANEPCTARWVSDTQAEVAGSLIGTLSYDDEGS